MNLDPTNQRLEHPDLDRPEAPPAGKNQGRPVAPVDLFGVHWFLCYGARSPVSELFAAKMA